jgi:hypothetical protein
MHSTATPLPTIRRHTVQPRALCELRSRNDQYATGRTNTVITYDAHDTITLVNVTASSVNQSNFHFG